MNITHIKDFETAIKSHSHVKEWRALSEQFPYFIIPKILTDLNEQHTISPQTIFEHKLNKTLIKLHFHQVAETEQEKEKEDQTVIAEVEPQSADKTETVVDDTIEPDVSTAESSKDANYKKLSEDYSDLGKNKESSKIGDIMEPVSGSDFYQSQGIRVSSEIPDKETLQTLHTQEQVENTSTTSDEQSLLVQMSFRDWLKTITETKRKEKEEEEEQKALKLKWKQQKLAEAIQEENEDIPEQVFKMAVESIEKEESLVSESLAEVYRLQGKYDQAISVYRKLILLNPEKRVYFADKIEQINKIL